MISIIGIGGQGSIIKKPCLSRERSTGNRLGNLGNAHSLLEEYPKAAEYYEEALAISREIKDRRGESNRLGNLGLAFRKLGKSQKRSSTMKKRWLSQKISGIE